MIRSAGLSTLEKTCIELFVIFEAGCGHEKECVESPYRVKVRRVGRG